MTRADRPVATQEAIREGLNAAVRTAFDEGSLAHVVGESGTVELAVRLRLDRGRVLFVDAGLGFHRRLF